MTCREVQYDLTVDDFLAFAAWTRRQTAGFRHPWLMRGLALIDIVVIIAIGAGFRDTDWEQYARLAITVLSAILVLLLYFLMPPGWRNWQTSSAIRRKFATDPYLQRELKRQRLTLTPNAVERHGGTGDSIAPWDSYDRVDASDDYLFFFHNANTGYPVPRRAFADEASFQDFAGFARACIEKSNGAKGKPPAPPSGPPRP